MQSLLFTILYILHEKLTHYRRQLQNAVYSLPERTNPTTEIFGMALSPHVVYQSRLWVFQCRYTSYKGFLVVRKELLDTGTKSLTHWSDSVKMKVSGRKMVTSRYKRGILYHLRIRNTHQKKPLIWQHPPSPLCLDVIQEKVGRYVPYSVACSYQAVNTALNHRQHDNKKHGRWTRHCDKHNIASVSHVGVQQTASTNVWGATTWPRKARGNTWRELTRVLRHAGGVQLCQIPLPVCYLHATFLPFTFRHHLSVTGSCVAGVTEKSLLSVAVWGADMNETKGRDDWGFAGGSCRLEECDGWTPFRL